MTVGNTYGICFRKIIVYFFCSQKCIYFFCDQNSLGFSQVQYSCENSIGWQALLQFLWNVKVHTTRYSVIFQKFPSRVRVGQKNPSSIRVQGTRWTLLCSVNHNPPPLITADHSPPLIAANHSEYDQFCSKCGLLTLILADVIIRLLGHFSKISE